MAGFKVIRNRADGNTVHKQTVAVATDKNVTEARTKAKGRIEKGSSDWISVEKR